MGLITKNELVYTDYSWTVLNGDNPKITGAPDSTLLNRNEGYEMLYFVNAFSEIHNFKNKVSPLKAERLIKEKVPANIHSQENIKLWLEQNWSEN